MRILTRYVLTRYVHLLILCYTGFVSVFVVVDLAGRLSVFIDRGIGAGGIVAYYAWSLPYVSILVLPMATLLAALFCFGQLARSGELDAMKAAGVSLYRIVLPALTAAAVTSVLAFGIGDLLMPTGNRNRTALERGERPRPTPALRSRVVLRDVDGQVLSVGQYYRKERRGTLIGIDRYDGQRLVQKLRAREMIWGEGVWQLQQGDVRQFHPDGKETVVSFERMAAVSLTLRPEDLAQEFREVDQMSTRELATVIQRKHKSGEAATRERVEWHLRWSFPFASFVMVLLGVPLSSGTRRAGRPMLVGVCLLTSFVYYGSIQAGRAMGWNGMLPPALGAWGANVLFLVAGSLLLARTHK